MRSTRSVGRLVRPVQLRRLWMDQRRCFLLQARLSEMCNACLCSPIRHISSSIPSMSVSRKIPAHVISSHPIHASGCFDCRSTAYHMSQRTCFLRHSLVSWAGGNEDKIRLCSRNNEALSCEEALSRYPWRHHAMCTRLYQPLGTITSLGHRTRHIEPCLSCYPLLRLGTVTACNNRIVNSYALSTSLHKLLELSEMVR
jgi:hypothetical protein